jgi:hypothetical protein
MIADDLVCSSARSIGIRGWLAATRSGARSRSAARRG